MRRMLVAVLVVLALSGCYTMVREIDIDVARQIKRGESTRADVKRLLKSPDSISVDACGSETWSYKYVQSKENPETQIRVFGMKVGGVYSESQFVIVHFGPDGKVSNLITNISGMETGSGASAGSKAHIPEVEEDKRPK